MSVRVRVRVMVRVPLHPKTLQPQTRVQVNVRLMVRVSVRVRVRVPPHPKTPHPPILACEPLLQPCGTGWEGREGKTSGRWCTPGGCGAQWPFQW